MLKKSQQTKRINRLKSETQKILRKSTQLIKSILSVIMIIFAFSTIFTNNCVRAQEITEYDLYSKENLYCLKTKGYLYRSEFVVYNYDGKEYPAYCLNRELSGVSLEKGGYKVKATELIQNDLVWKALINGYPYKSYQELGCNNEMEAFTATKLAAYDMMYNYNFNDFVAVNEAGERVIAAMKSISNIARNSNQERVKPSIQLIQTQEQWKLDDNNSNYIYKTYKIIGNSELSNYIVEIDSQNIQAIKLENTENIATNVFKNNEEFKVSIPIEQMQNENQISISVKANLKTYPIYYGKAPENLQNYALTGIEYETATATLNEIIPENETSIIINKIDGENKQPLQGCKFYIMSSNGEIKHELITDENGRICKEKVLPGEYNIKEIEALQGYIKNEEDKKIIIGLNDKIELFFENFKEPIIEQPPEPVIEQPVIEQIPEPIVEQPIIEEIPEPVIEEPVIEQIPEPIVEELIIEQPEQPIKLPKTGF